MNKNIIWGIVIVAGIILLLIGIFGYFSLKYQPKSNTSVTTAQSASTTQSSDNFSKQLACSNERPQVEAAIVSYNASQHASYSCATTDPCGTYKSSENLYSLFYSPNLNTCLDVVESQTFLETATTSKLWFDDYDINDVLTGDMKDYINLVQHGSPYYSSADLLKKLTEYEPTSSSPTNIGQP